MTVTAAYQPEFYSKNETGLYVFLMESIGSAALEVYEIDSNDQAHFLPSNFYTARFRGRRPIFDGGQVFILQHQIPDVAGIKIVRNTPIDQTVDWKRVERFPMKMIEFALDKLTMILQELFDRLCETSPPGTYTTEITQTIAFEAYAHFPAAEVNFALDKLFTIMAEIDANKETDPDKPFAEGN